jgi:membrane protein implicated in regulation of membrane protease activity
MIDLFLHYGPWSWLVVGLVLMALEIAAPGVFLFWLGLAAMLTGLLSGAIHMSWEIQLIAFAVLSLAAVPIWRRVARAKSSEPEHDFLNRRSDALVGRVFTLDKPIQDGFGTVRVDDTIWRVAGPDTPAGSRVRVVHADGASLTVAGA